MVIEIRIPYGAISNTIIDTIMTSSIAQPSGSQNDYVNRPFLL